MASHIVLWDEPIMPRYGAMLSQLRVTDWIQSETYHGVPGARAKTERVVTYTETADSVVVPLQCANTLATQDVPYLALG